MLKNDFPSGTQHLSAVDEAIDKCKVNENCEFWMLNNARVVVN